MKLQAWQGLHEQYNEKSEIDFSIGLNGSLEIMGSYDLKSAVYMCTESLASCSNKG